MANVVDTAVDTAATQKKEQSPAADHLITKESPTKTATTTTMPRRYSVHHVSAIDRDMMDWSPQGEAPNQDQKGLGGCRIQ